MQGQLTNMFMAQMQVLPYGVAGPEQLYQTLLEMAKLAGHANPGKFLIDPAMNPPPPPPPNPDMVKIQAEQQSKQQALQADAQKFKAQADQERNKAMFDAVQKDKTAKQSLRRHACSKQPFSLSQNSTPTLQLCKPSKGHAFEAQKLGATFQREDMAKQQEQTQTKDDGMASLLSVQKLGQSLQTLRREAIPSSLVCVCSCCFAMSSRWKVAPSF